MFWSGRSFFVSRDNEELQSFVGFFHFGLYRGDSDISVATQRTRHKEHHSDGNKGDKDVLVLPVRCVLTKEKRFTTVFCVVSVTHRQQK